MEKEKPSEELNLCTETLEWNFAYSTEQGEQKPPSFHGFPPFRRGVAIPRIGNPSTSVRLWMKTIRPGLATPSL